jgi:hypothetical protein
VVRIDAQDKDLAQRGETFQVHQNRKSEPQARLFAPSIVEQDRGRKRRLRQTGTLNKADTARAHALLRYL